MAHPRGTRGNVVEMVIILWECSFRPATEMDRNIPTGSDIS